MQFKKRKLFACIQSFFPSFPFVFPLFDLAEDASLTRTGVLLREENDQGCLSACFCGYVLKKTEVVCVYSIILSFIFPICFSLHLHFWGRIVDPLLGFIVAGKQSSLICVFSCAMQKKQSRLRIFYHFLSHFLWVYPSFWPRWGRIVDPHLGLIVARKPSRLLASMYMWLCGAKNWSRLRLFYHFILHFPCLFFPSFSLHLYFWGRIVDPLLGFILAGKQSRLL